MRQQVIGNCEALRSQLVAGSGEIDRVPMVPMHDRRRDQSQARGVEALVFECAVADFALAMEADGTAQRIAGLYQGPQRPQAPHDECAYQGLMRP